MSTQLDALPVEMLAHVALFLDRYSTYSKSDNSLLALRSVSRAGLDAVRRAIKNHPTNDVRLGSANDARQITAIGQVLGSGCQKLYYYGPYNTPSPDTLNALQQVILGTQGRLRELSLCSSLISPQRFLEICRACPQLKELTANWGVPNIASADVDVFAAELSRSCPLLESVAIQTNAPWSPAESYAMYFPNLKCLDLEAENPDDSGYEPYEPSRFDKIEAAAHQCVGAEELGLGRCSVSADLAERLLRTPLQSRIKSLYLHEADVSQEETVIRFAEGLEMLSSIVFPHGFFASPEIFTSLARARPSLKELYFDDGSFIDNACVAAICENLKLEKLQLDCNRRLTPSVVDIILQSPTAETLSWACFSNTVAFSSAGILRLARECPRLAQLTWRVQGLRPLADGNGKNVDDLTALLKGRCRGHSNWHFSVDPFRKFGPWKLAEVGWAYRDYPIHSEPQGFYAYNH